MTDLMRRNLLAEAGSHAVNRANNEQRAMGVWLRQEPLTAWVRPMDDPLDRDLVPDLDPLDEEWLITVVQPTPKGC